MDLLVSYKHSSSSSWCQAKFFLWSLFFTIFCYLLMLDCIEVFLAFLLLWISTQHHLKTSITSGRQDSRSVTYCIVTRYHQLTHAAHDYSIIIWFLMIWYESETLFFSSENVCAWETILIFNQKFVSSSHIKVRSAARIWLFFCPGPRRSGPQHFGFSTHEWSLKE